MKKVIIVGGGIAGLSAGVYLQQAGIASEIYEKNAIVGGQCMAWKRDGYMIDNCIHWLTGSKEGSSLNQVWHDIGALNDTVVLHRKELFLHSELNGEQITFWRDLEKTRKEMLELSPEDEVEINKLIDNTKLCGNVSVPTEKPFDEMNIFDYIKMGKEMKDLLTVMKEYGGIDTQEMGMRFKHPLLRQALVDYMPAGYQAYSFLVSYGTVAGDNGDVPEGGSLAMVMRIAEKYQKLGGVIHTNANVTSVKVDGNQAKGIVIDNAKLIEADYVICACDTSFTFGTLLDSKYMPKGLRTLYEKRKEYPVTSGFQVAYAIDGCYKELTGTRIFSCEDIKIGKSTVNRMSSNYYEYEKTFAPEGKTVLQSNFVQNEDDYEYWKELYKNQEAYKSEKQRIAKLAVERLIHRYPFLEGKVRVLDVWTPYTYTRYCNAFKGSYMSFVITKNAKSITVPGKLKGLHNVFIASQWQMGPGGLPTAAAMGKFAALRVIKKEK